MADPKDKWDENIAGRFYVDRSCIACDACVHEAPGFFAMNDIEGHAFVKLQPTNEKELELCKTALSLCPVEAIGDDGDK
jgi:ferredoxin